jgi:DNA-binding CsgD family transcriptional regulator
MRRRSWEEEARIGARRVMAGPGCAIHAGSFVRRQWVRGPSGGGVYRVCTPGGDEEPHVLPSLGVESVLSLSDKRNGLTPGELDVLEDAANGLTVIESAVARRSSCDAVKSRRRSILRKLRAKTMTHAVGMTLDHGMLLIRH